MSVNIVFLIQYHVYFLNLDNFNHLDSIECYIRKGKMEEKNRNQTKNLWIGKILFK